jgi:glycosyltransferase involved in cell wall biosynthesis
MPLMALSRLIDFRLRIISEEPWSDPPLPVEFVPFSEAAASDALLTSSVGLAPLSDDPWTQGKCAMRAIQYGGHALPTVASPVGITDQVVLDGETGILARSDEEWLAALRVLIDDPARARRMGAAALARVRRLYSDDVAVQLWSQTVASVERK